MPLVLLTTYLFLGNENYTLRRVTVRFHGLFFSQSLSHCLAPTRDKCVHALSAPRLVLLTQPTSHYANHTGIRGQVTVNIKSDLIPCIKFLGTEISSNGFQNCRRIKLRTQKLSSGSTQKLMCLPIKQFAVLTKLPAIWNGPKILHSAGYYVQPGIPFLLFSFEPIQLLLQGRSS